MGTVHPLHGKVEWPSGPPTEQVSELVRTLELTITRRLDGALHGNHQGITPDMIVNRILETVPATWVSPKPNHALG